MVIDWNGKWMHCNHTNILLSEYWICLWKILYERVYLFIFHPLYNKILSIFSSSSRWWILWILYGFRKHILTSSTKNDLEWVHGILIMYNMNMFNEFYRQDHYYIYFRIVNQLVSNVPAAILDSLRGQISIWVPASVGGVSVRCTRRGMLDPGGGYNSHRFS